MAQLLMLETIKSRLHYTVRRVMVIENIDIRCKKKSTNKNELHWNLGHFKVTKYLIENGANINDKDNHGMTALHFSSSYGSWKYWY